MSKLNKILRFYGVFFALCAASSLQSDAGTPPQKQASQDIPKKFRVEFLGYKKDFDVVRPSPASPVSIAYVNFRQEVPLLQAAVKALLEKLPKDFDCLVVAGDKANGLGTLMAVQKGCPMVVIIAKKTPEGVAESVDCISITSGKKTVYLSPAQLEILRAHKKLVVLDDVISTGGTMQSLVSLLHPVKDKIAAIACVCTEGDKRTDFARYPLVSLAHLPVWPHQ